MPYRKSGRTPRNLLIIVLVLLALNVLLLYALKHDLPPAPALRAWADALTGADAGEKAEAAAQMQPDMPEETGEQAAQEPSAPPEMTPGPELDGQYYAYLADTLVPLYGLADETAVANACAAHYRFEAGAAPEGAVGILSAAVIDTNGDAMTELAVLYIDGGNETFPLLLRVYAVENGKVVEPVPDAPVTVTTLRDNLAASGAGSVEIVSGEGHAYVLYHVYTESTGAVCDLYTALDITGGKAEQVLRGAFSMYDNPVLVLDVVPPWLDAAAVQGAPEADDAASGLHGKLLYSDGVEQYAYADGTVDIVSYKGLYASAIDATAAMLGPLSGTERIKLLEPLSLDWTGFRFALTEDADAAEE